MNNKPHNCSWSGLKQRVSFQGWVWESESAIIYCIDVWFANQWTGRQQNGMTTACWIACTQQIHHTWRTHRTAGKHNQGPNHLGCKLFSALLSVQQPGRFTLTCISPDNWAYLKRNDILLYSRSTLKARVLVIVAGPRALVWENSSIFFR